jgi:hypothetical protein
MGLRRLQADMEHRLQQGDMGSSHIYIHMK